VQSAGGWLYDRVMAGLGGDRAATAQLRYPVAADLRGRGIGPGVRVRRDGLDDRDTASKAEFCASPAFDGEAADLMWRYYLGSASGSAAAVPARRNGLAGLPPALIMCAEIDPFRDEAVDYALQLLRARVSTELHVFPHTCHGFDSLLPDWSTSERLFTLQGQALRRVWHGA